MKLIAHRGMSSTNVENTYDAFVSALEHTEIDGIECDIRQTKDNVFVVMHDAFINRTTSGSGLVSNMTYSDLKKYNVLRLEEVLELTDDKIILLELKDTRMGVEKFVKLVNEYQTKKIYVDSFYNDLMHKVIKCKPKFKVGILNYVANSEKSYNEYDFVCLLKSVVTNNLLKFFFERNIEVFIYGFLDETKIVAEEQLIDKCYLIRDF